MFSTRCNACGRPDNCYKRTLSQPTHYVVEWADIEAIDTARMGTERFLVLRTHQPEKYIERATNGLMRGALRANHRMTGSPLNISARALDISFEELHTTLQAAWERQSAA